MAFAMPLSGRRGFAMPREGFALGRVSNDNAWCLRVSRATAAKTRAEAYDDLGGA